MPNGGSPYGSNVYEQPSSMGVPQLHIDQPYFNNLPTGTIGSGVNLAESEIPSGTINGTNRTFTLANAPVSGSIKVFSDGIRINPNQYTVSTTTLTFNAGSVNIPVNTLLVDYRY